MVKSIVIVESPTKVKTINKMLGRNFKVVSSMGHLIDLPKSTLGVDLENDFEPKFIAVRSKSKILSKLKKDVKTAKEIYVATDPDREGEAIGWNLVNHIGEGKKIYRVSFQEITKTAVLKAFDNVREFDKNLINAQVTRRVLDRIVGYKLSPILWKKVGSRLSAGRVQSVALKVIVERERAIEVFNPFEYWSVEAIVQKQGQGELISFLEKIDHKALALGSKEVTDDLVEELKTLDFVVSKIVNREVKRKAVAPLITSTMQQEAFNKLKFSAVRTMMLAQQLYEGINLGDGDAVGLITYMRTDSVNISEEAIGKVREFIGKTYGKEYLPGKANRYKSKKSAQEAHEAIRPSDVLYTPQDLRQYLDEDQLKLYTLIWNRFVGSQIVPSVYESRKIEIVAGRCQFGTSCSILKFDGCLVVDSKSIKKTTAVDFSCYKKGDVLNLNTLNSAQHFTKPPPRFSDASLVKTLEEGGVGRPSTYASIILTLISRNYIIRDKGYFKPTELGMLILDLLVENFPKVIDEGFTANMESKLDLVEEGKLTYVDLMRTFYEPFSKELEVAERVIEKTYNFIDKKCPECNGKLVVKWGRRGKFISCLAFPECRHAESFTLGVPCPEDGCDGDLVERRSKKGQTFYGCSKYPKCEHISNTLPDKDKQSEPDDS